MSSYDFPIKYSYIKEGVYNTYLILSPHYIKIQTLGLICFVLV